MERFKIGNPAHEPVALAMLAPVSALIGLATKALYDWLVSNHGPGFYGVSRTGQLCRPGKGSRWELCPLPGQACHHEHHAPTPEPVHEHHEPPAPPAPPAHVEPPEPPEPKVFVNIRESAPERSPAKKEDTKDYTKPKSSSSNGKKSNFATFGRKK